MTTKNETATKLPEKLQIIESFLVNDPDESNSDYAVVYDDDIGPELVKRYNAFEPLKSALVSAVQTMEILGVNDTAYPVVKARAVLASLNPPP